MSEPPVSVPASPDMAANDADPTARATRPAARVRDLLLTTTVVLTPVAVLYLLWQGRTALFLLFAAILFATVLDAGARGLGRAVSAPRMVRLALVIALVLVMTLALAWFGGTMAFQQIGDLLDALRRQATDLAEFFSRLDGETGEPRADEGMSLARLAERVGSLFGPAGSAPLTAAQAIMGVGANTLFIFFMGCFLAIAPGTYRDGTASLFPLERRTAIARALDDAGETLRHWLMGKLLSMAAIALLTVVGLWLIDYPYAIALGVLAGLLAFVPNIGPILFYIPLGLVGLSAGMSTLLWGFGVYLAAQTLESYILTPYIQSRMVYVAPALIFFMQLLLGVLFGAWGVALATPLTAVAVLWVRNHWIAGTLERNG